jgi:hypothetical protein
MIQEINALALAKAAEFVVGEEKALEIGRIYRIIDDAMFAGYELGTADALQVLQKQTDDAFDAGFDEGAEQGHTEGYDSGYLNGVGDARARPSVADSNVREIIGEELRAAEDQLDMFAAEEDYDDVTGCGDPYCHICGDPGEDFYEGDSGDETPSDGAIYAAVSARA